MASFLQDLLSVFRSKVALILFGLGKAIIVARLLGPELNGIISALVVYPALFMTIGSLGIRKAAAYHIGKKTYSEQHISTAITQIWFLSTIFSVLVCFLLIKYTSNSSDNIELILLAIAPIPFQLLNTYISGMFLGKNQIKEFNSINWLPALFTFLSTALFVFLLQFSIRGALIAEIVGPAMMTIILLNKKKFLAHFSLKFQPKIIRDLLGLGITFAISLLIMNLNYRVDVILMDRLSNPYEVGIYSKGSVLIQYLWQIPMLLGTLVFARGVNSEDKRIFSLKVCQLMRLSVLIIFFGTIFLSLFSSFIIDLLFGSAFAESAQILIYLAPGVLLLTIFKVLNMDISGQGKPWISMQAMIPALILNVVLNIWLIPEYGAAGAALTSTISYTFASVLFIFIYSKTAHIPLRDVLLYKKADFDLIKPLWKKVKNKISKQ